MSLIKIIMKKLCIGVQTPDTQSQKQNPKENRYEI